jgi:hypothetical protein
MEMFLLKFLKLYFFQICKEHLILGKLQGNNLQGAFPNIEQLKILKYLDISSNQFTAFNSYSIYKHVQKL